MRAEQARLMAGYNRWMNERLYEVAATLSDAERKLDRGAFFRSIHGTLNHLLLADHIWLGRFKGETYQAKTLAEELHGDFVELREERVRADRAIIDWADKLSDEALLQEFEFSAFTSPIRRRCALWKPVTHFFNHQTHHRGQLTDMLSQAGVDYGVTDLLWMDGVLEEL